MLYKIFLLNRIQYEDFYNKKAHNVCSFSGCNFDLLYCWCLLCCKGDNFAESVIYHCHRREARRSGGQVRAVNF